MFQQWIGLGRMTAQPEIRQSQAGNSIATFTIATDSGYGEYKHTEFTRCVCLIPKLAEVIGNYGEKGKLYQVKGIFKTRQWEDNSGVKKYSTECNVDSFLMLSPKSEGGGQYQEPSGGDAQGGFYGGNTGNTGSDVPFNLIY